MAHKLDKLHLVIILFLIIQYSTMHRLSLEKILFIYFSNEKKNIRNNNNKNKWLISWWLISCSVVATILFLIIQYSTMHRLSLEKNLFIYFSFTWMVPSYIFFTYHHTTTEQPNLHFQPKPVQQIN